MYRATVSAPLRIRPVQLAVPEALLTADLDRPLPAVVEGTVEEWHRAVDAVTAARSALQDACSATLAIVRGELDHGLGEVLEPFDLVASGPEADRQAERWLAAFDANPQTATVLIHTVRAAPSLLTESLAYSTLQSGPEHARWLSSRPAPSRPPAGPRVRVLAGKGLSTITLARPERHNALDSLMREELCDALDALIADPQGPIVVTGEGASFCSGGDLNEFGLRVDPVHAHLVRTSRSVAARLDRLSGRTVSAVHGACVGAGLELAAFATRVIVADDALFRLPEIGFGLIPGSGGTVSVRRRVGRRALLDLALTGREVTSEEALSLGLADAACRHDDLLEVACRTARALGGAGARTRAD